MQAAGDGRQFFFLMSAAIMALYTAYSAVFVITVDEETQCKHMKSRDTSISEEEIKTRINVNKEFDEIFKEKDLFEHIYFNDEEKENIPVDHYNSVNDIFQ